MESHRKQRGNIFNTEKSNNFKDKPRKTGLTKCHIDAGSKDCFGNALQGSNYEGKEVTQDQWNQMLKEGIVSAAGRSWASPVLLVHFLWQAVLDGSWEIKWCHPKKINICRLRLMAQ